MDRYLVVVSAASLEGRQLSGAQHFVQFLFRGPGRQRRDIVHLTIDFVFGGIFFSPLCVVLHHLCDICIVHQVTDISAYLHIWQARWLSGGRVPDTISYSPAF